jgi:hypothetical protein
MATWDPNDLNGFNACKQNNVGQITKNCRMGQYLIDAARNSELSTFLEVGTWNGLGSTRCIVDGLLQRPSYAKPYVFYSLECNTDKCKMAQEMYKHIPNVHILNEVFLNDMPNDIYTIFPELAESPQFQYWNSVDFENMNDKSLFLNRSELPELFDMVLLDGGEFTTWYEYLAIRDRCKILALDDTNVMKCKRIVADLKAQPSRWQIIIEDIHERNGNVVARRIDL